MAHSDTLLIGMIYLQFAFFLLPGVAWLTDRALHRFSRKPPEAWAGRRLHSQHSRFRSYREGVVGRAVRPGLTHV